MLRHWKILEYALLSLLRRKGRNAAVGVVVVGLFAVYGLRAALTPAMPGPLVARPRVDAGRAT